MSGKGDKLRPVDKERYDRNWDVIRWNRKCPQCEGKGFVHVYVRDVDDVRWDDCPLCDGMGEVRV